VESQLLKIDTLAPGHFLLAGALTAAYLPLLGEALAACPSPAVLDLSGVVRVDREAVAFLLARLPKRLRLENAPSYVETWLRSERRGAGRVLTLVAAAVLAALPAMAAEPLRVSLGDAIARTLREGTVAQLADEQIASARFTARRARSALLPQMDVAAIGGNQSLNLDVLGFHLGEPTVDPYNLMEARLTVRVAILDLAAIHRHRAAQAQVAVTEAERRRLRSEAAAAVARLYVGLLKARALVEQNDATARLFERVLGLARRQRDAGVVSRLDALRAEVQLNQQRRLLLMARQRREEVQRALLEAMGADIGAELVPTDELAAETAAAPAPNVAELLRVARARRPELASLREQHRAAGKSIRAAQAERLPALHAGAHVEEGGNDLSNLHYTRGVGVQLSIPLFTGGRIGAEVGEARSRQRAVEIRQRAAERLVERQVRDAVRALETARERVTNAGHNARLTGEELESTQNRFGVGVTASVEVDNAQTAYVNAREELISAQADVAQARVDLDFATGQLAPDAPTRN
jgi:outer membrane protein